MKTCPPRTRAAKRQKSSSPSSRGDAYWEQTLNDAERRVFRLMTSVKGMPRNLEDSFIAATVDARLGELLSAVGYGTFARDAAVPRRIRSEVSPDLLRAARAEPLRLRQADADGPECPRQRRGGNDLVPPADKRALEH